MNIQKPHDEGFTVKFSATSGNSRKETGSDGHERSA